MTIPQRPGPRRVDCGPALGKLHGGRLLKDGAWSWPVGRFGVRTDAAFAEAWNEGRKLTLDEAVALALDTNLDA